MILKTYAAAAALTIAATQAHATLVEITDCTNAVACDIVVPVTPYTVSQNPDDGKLIAWNEVQNYTLLQDLAVDRVADESAPFITKISNNNFLIKAGTIVSSHYVQWDNLPGTNNNVQATITLDSPIFAFITADQKMFNSDFLGLAGVDYNDFGLRGLEAGDDTVFDGNSVNIDWSATSPGDWTRLITAYSPGGQVPVPAALPLLLGGMGVRGFAARRRRKT